MANIPTEVHELLAVQHGLVSRTQLLAHRTANQIKHLLRRGDLVLAGRNVYRSPSVAETELARCAALCLGRPGLVITGPTAGRIWGLRKMTSDQRMHVLMSPQANSVTPSKTLVARRTSTLRPDDIDERADGIRITHRARTCIELARTLKPDPLLSVIEKSMLDAKLTATDMREAAIGLMRGRPWVGTYLEQLDRRLDGGAAESDGEVRVGEALREHGIDGLVRQFRLALPEHREIRFDLALPELRWAVEIDLFPTHEETVGSAADAQRDFDAGGEGWVVRRISSQQYHREFSTTIASLVSDVRSRTDARNGPSPQQW